MSGEALVRFVRDEVFSFYAEVAEHGAFNFMEGARLGIDEPTSASPPEADLPGGPVDFRS